MTTLDWTPVPAEPDAEARGAAARMPPQDLGAERAVLGGMLLSQSAIADVLETRLTPGDFYRPAHELVFSAALSLYGRGEPVDAVTVAAELTKRGEAARVGGGQYLLDCMASVPTAANAGYYAEIVRTLARRRRLIESGTRITQMGYETDGDDIDEIEDRAQAELYAATDDPGGNDYAPAGVGMEDMLRKAEAKRGGQVAGVPTGLEDLDALTNGLHPGQMIIVAARPAIGKSTLGLDLARSCSIRHGLTSVIFSLEMGREEIQQRLMSAEARVPLHHLRNGGMTDDDWARVAKHDASIVDAPLFLDVSPNMTLMEIRAKCRQLKQRHDLRLVIVDYLQLISYGGTRRQDNRQQEVSDLSRSLKLLAKELEVPVVAICQLNRGPEQRTDKRPMMSDLRESGSLEQDADVVVLLHREDAYERESPRAGEADLIVAKHRNGPTATITAAFQGHYSRFVDMAQS